MLDHYVMPYPARRQYFQHYFVLHSETSGDTQQHMGVVPGPS